MTADTASREDIETLAGTEDAEGVIQPGVEEILDPDPEHADAEDMDEEGFERDAEPDGEAR